MLLFYRKIYIYIYKSQYKSTDETADDTLPYKDIDILLFKRKKPINTKMGENYI